MARRPYDPLAFVPSPDVIRVKLRETRSLAERLQLLLEISERMQPQVATTDSPAPLVQRSTQKVVTHAG